MSIINIGSLNIDRTYRVVQFVRPKETIKAQLYEEFCGGKGLNQSIALASAGADVYHVGAVGRDGGQLIQMLSEKGVNTTYVKVYEDTASGHAVIQIDQEGQNNIIIWKGANDKVSCRQIDEALDKFQAGDLVLLQNEISNVAYAMEAARARGMKLIFNPSPVTKGLREYPLHLVDYFILNELEAQALAELASDDIAEIRRGLREKYPNAVFILTLGECGAWYFDKTRTYFHPSFKVEAVDTTAAGDTFSGYFIAGLAEAYPAERCLKEASAAAALAVCKKGAALSVPSQQEVENFLKNQSNILT